MRHPGFRKSAVATATALLHGGLIALALHAAAPAVARHEPSRVMLRMIAPAKRSMVSAPAAAAVKPVTPVPRPRAAARAAAPPVTPAPAITPAAAEPISGAVFALPRIGFGGGNAAPRWMARAAAAMPDVAAMAQAAREADRVQSLCALQSRQQRCDEE